MPLFQVEYNTNFKLILHTKMANPHYKPEMQAQTTLINFTVTIDGLEDQLLAAVVSKERPDLEKTKADLTRQQNEFKITLKSLEDNLLARLSAAEGNFLGDYELVENLEKTKRTANEIEVQVEEGKITEIKINEARELYRPAAAQASLLYFILNELNIIHPMYQFSLKVSHPQNGADNKQLLHILATLVVRCRKHLRVQGFLTLLSQPDVWQVGMLPIAESQTKHTPCTGFYT